MLSLAKLALLASNDTEEEVEDDVKRIDSGLALIAHQEDLPAQVLAAYGYDIEKLRVFTPTELITVFIFDLFERILCDRVSIILVQLCCSYIRPKTTWTRMSTISKRPLIYSST